MKKIGCLLGLLLLVVLCSSCSLFALDAPTGVKSMGRYITWSAVEDAVEYEVLVDGVVQDTTEELFYLLPDQDEDAKVTVQALAEGGKRRSKPSDEIKVCQSTAFASADVMKIEMVSEKVQYIPPTVRYVRVTGNAVEARIIIQDRQDDLVIELGDTVIKAPAGTDCITTESELSCAVYLVLAGDAELSVADVTEVPETPANNSNKVGSNGIHGGDAIYVKNLILCGEGSLTLSGGNGGQGGKGSTASGLFTLATSQNGGNGGNGGCGIRCTNLILDMAQVSQRIRAAGGTGGAGGAHGKITVSVSGGVTGAMGVLKDGSKGLNGVGVSASFTYKNRGIIEEIES